MHNVLCCTCRAAVVVRAAGKIHARLLARVRSHRGVLAIFPRHSVSALDIVPTLFFLCNQLDWLTLSLVTQVLRFPVSFFDTTPTGRILNRFAHDVDQVDTQISQALEQQMEWSLRAAIALMLVCSILPSIIVFMLPVLWSLNKVGQLFRFTSREVRRLDSTTRSPIYAHFSETLSGLSTIRTFGDNYR